MVAVRRLGALAFFVEALKDLVGVPTAVLLARGELGRQTRFSLRLVLTRTQVTAPIIGGSLDLFDGTRQGAFRTHYFAYAKDTWKTPKGFSCV